MKAPAHPNDVHGSADGGKDERIGDDGRNDDGSNADSSNNDSSDNDYCGYDVLVVGAGPAGLAAAHAAAALGARVAVVDDNPAAGGQIWRGGPAQQMDARARRLWTALRSTGQVRFMQQCRVLFAPAPGQLLVQSPSASATLRYKRLVLATGARELLLPFPGWTLPGVTGAGGLQALAKGGYPVAGKRVVVAGTGPLLLAAAATLKQQGAHIVAIVEQAAPAGLARFAAGLLATPSKLLQALRLARTLRGVRYLHGSWISEARGGDGSSKDCSDGSNGGRHSDADGGDHAHGLRSVLLRRGGGKGKADVVEELACDFLACGYGLLPNLELAMSLGCATGRSVSVDAWQRSSVPDIYCAGEATGVGGVDLALAEGRIAGMAAAGQADIAGLGGLGGIGGIGYLLRRWYLFRERARWQAFAGRLERAFALRADIAALARDDTIVCRCEDVRHGELRAHDSWRAAKLQTRCGMGPCQGRICGAAADLLYGWRPDSVRMPLSPARVDSIIG